MSEIILQIQGVTRNFGGLVAIDNVDIDVEKSSITAIIGPNGAGKTTLINLITGVYPVSKGQIIFNDRPIHSYSPTKRCNMGIVRTFQHVHLFSHMSALENVMLPLLYSRNGQTSEIKQKDKALQVLEAVGLADRVEHQPQELSGGQAQRVAIARALVNDPVIILADEPTGNLDTKSGEEIMQVLSELHRNGRTIVMVTHEDEIAAYAQRVIRFLDGRIETDVLNGENKQLLQGEGLQVKGVTS